MVYPAGPSHVIVSPDTSDESAELPVDDDDVLSVGTELVSPDSCDTPVLDRQPDKLVHTSSATSNRPLMFLVLILILQTSCNRFSTAGDFLPMFQLFRFGNIPKPADKKRKSHDAVL